MKVFVSSLIAGYEPYREAATAAIETLGHKIVRAEDFAALPGTPQQACLGAVRESDVVVLLLGEHYGAVQASGLSATHEEYEEAKERKPLLVFVQSGVNREPAQQAFLDDVQAWSTGHFRASFTSPEELKALVVRAMHEHELATAAGGVDEAEIQARATALLENDRISRSRAQLALAVAGGPYQQILRPVEIEQEDLSRDLQSAAMFGDFPVLDRSKGTASAIRGGVLALEQESASLLVNQAGSIRVIQPAQQRADVNQLQHGISSLIEEDLLEALLRAVQFTGWLLDRIDPLHRITDVVPVARLNGAGYMPWRTRAEQAASPNAATMGAGSEVVTATLMPARRHRQALMHDAGRIAEDLIALLRREVRR